MKKIGTRLLCMALVCSFLTAVLNCGALAAAAPVEKHETVYVITDAAGAPQEVIASDWLENHDGAEVLDDSSNLTDIETVKGSATATGGGSSLRWNAGGEDVYYQGSSAEELPVGVTISYLLDGEEIAPEELAGKSGDLTIRIQYENRTAQTVTVDGRQETMAVPFFMATALVLPSDQCKNITVDHGLVENDGDRFIVLTYGCPGLADSLQLEEDIPLANDGAEITAQVTDFSLELAATVASPSALNDLELDGDETLAELEEKLNELEDAATELTDGTQTLLTGAQALLDGATQVQSGVAQADDGAGKLAPGAAAIRDNLGVLHAGLETATGAMGTLAGGLSDLQDGASDLNSGLGQLQSGTSQLQGVAAQMQGGIAALQDGVQELKTGADTLQQSAAGGMDQVSAGCANASAALTQTIAADQGVLSALQGMLASCDPAAEPERYAALSGVISALQQSIGSQSAVQAALSEGGDLQAGLATLKEGLATGVTTLQGGLDSLNTGLGSLKTGADGVYGGASTLSGYIGTAADGAKLLGEKLGDAFGGAQQIQGGLGTALGGVVQLYDGSITLAGGVEALYAGTQALRRGTASLTEGAQALADGAGTLADGMQTFQAEGISRLVNLYRDNIPQLVHRLQALQALGQDYGAYSGQADGVRADTKFLFRCDAIEES